MNNILRVDRMRVEIEELRNSMWRLMDFIYDSPEYDLLERCEKVNLIKQLNAMECYERTLAKRIFWAVSKK